MSLTILSMTATFGTLEQAVLTPGDGLTVITAPNEAGKSTWAAFLKAMFYGLDTKERDKTGYLAEKNRYQPWSGAPMSGEMQVEWNGRGITLRRTTGRSGPMQQFEAVYTATGDPVPGLTGANVGEQMLGISREVFVRSALVGQNCAAVTPSPELERRVAALATTGEEDVSAATTQRTLKDWRNRRRSNRSNGLIPELDGQLHTLEQTLEELELARGHAESAQRQIDALTARRQELEQEQEVHRRLAAQKLNRRLGQAQEQLEQAQAQLDALPPCPAVFEGLTAAQAGELADELERQAQEHRRLREEHAARAPLCRRRKLLKTLLKLVVALFGAGGLVMVIAGFIAAVYPLSYWGFALMFAATALSIVLVLLLGRIDQKLNKLAEAAPDDVPPVPDAGAYAHWLVRRNALLQEVRHCRERCEDLAAQGAQPFQTLELLQPPTRSTAETAAQLRDVEQELTRWQTRLDQAIGALRADPLELEAGRETLRARREQRSAEYEAIDLALNVLEEANAALRERFSPALNREAATLFSTLTGSRYTTLTLSRDFSALTGDGTDSHSSLYLSTGTMDQLYLSVRLALCRLTAPQAPILLDDALCAFDDARMALALEALNRLANTRQIFLFSCHDREARWARQHGIPTLTL